MRFTIIKKRFTLIGIISILWLFPGLSYSSDKSPKLFIIITIDQLRADYLIRYDKAFTGGFRRLRDEGWRFDKGIVDKIYRQLMLHDSEAHILGLKKTLFGKMQFPRSLGSWPGQMTQNLQTIFCILTGIPISPGIQPRSLSGQIEFSPAE